MSAITFRSACLGFASAGAIFALASALPVIAQDCPHEMPSEQQCPTPELTQRCGNFAQALCPSKHGQYKENGYWGCELSEGANQCLPATTESLCYTDYACKWFQTAPPKCDKDLDTADMYYKTDKDIVACPGT